MLARPLVLPPNIMRRMYRGGGLLAAFRRTQRQDDRMPEDWVASTVPVRGETEIGRARLADGSLLSQALLDDPVGMLGLEHVREFGPDPRILVKLFDADERLPIHCHPSRAFAEEHFRSPFGKTEASVVVGTRRGEATLFLGFSRDVGETELSDIVAAQDHESLLGLLNDIRLSPGDAVFVPGGVPHALDAGALVLEIQEPTDLSILLEWDGFDIDVELTRRGLSLPDLIKGVDRTAYSLESIEGLIHRASEPVEASARRFSLLPPAADRFFRVEQVSAGPGVELEPCFSIFIVTERAGVMTWANGSSNELRLEPGMAILIPFSVGATEIRNVTGLRCMPPIASAETTS